MPHSRRRKFSVQNDISRMKPTNANSSETTSIPALEPPMKNKIKVPIYANTTRAIDPLVIVPECDEESSASLAKPLDKQVTESSRATDNSESLKRPEPPRPTPRTSKRDTLSMDRSLREISRHHRVRVRSPKHRLLILDTPNTETAKEDVRPYGTDVNVSTVECFFTETVGTYAIDWAQEMPICSPIEQVLDLETIEYDRPSDQSISDMCRICHGGESLSPELGRLISACSCRGTVGRVHVRCLERWLTESGKSRCELCGTRYATRRVHRYGVPKALVMWFLSQNAKQLMVDSLGIMLMSPLAVLAAWLSGRTLAGLMTQESQVTPWPLASTFVLACMTLVCYYCWIVSAATRHALGWWIWYRSQYEVRLQIQDEE